MRAIGEADEANAAIGAARAACADADLDGVLEAIQNDLFVLGAGLAAHGGDGMGITEQETVRLEETIDRLEVELEPLRRFILPGGCPLAAQLHLARAVCRRAERAVVALAARENVGSQAVTYLNRLSDLLFVLARTANRRAHVEEVTWRAEAEK